MPDALCGLVVTSKQPKCPKISGFILSPVCNSLCAVLHRDTRFGACVERGHHLYGAVLSFWLLLPEESQGPWCEHGHN